MTASTRQQIGEHRADDVDRLSPIDDADALAPAELFDTSRRNFGGTFCPTVPIGIDGDHVCLSVVDTASPSGRAGPRAR